MLNYLVLNGYFSASPYILAGIFLFIALQESSTVSHLFYLIKGFISGAITGFVAYFVVKGLLYFYPSYQAYVPAVIPMDKILLIGSYLNILLFIYLFIIAVPLLLKTLGIAKRWYYLAPIISVTSSAALALVSNFIFTLN